MNAQRVSQLVVLIEQQLLEGILRPVMFGPPEYVEGMMTSLLAVYLFLTKDLPYEECNSMILQKTKEICPDTSKGTRPLYLSIAEDFATTVDYETLSARLTRLYKLCDIDVDKLSRPPI